MAWERLISHQTTRFTALVEDALDRWKKMKAHVGDDAYPMAHHLARDAVALWSRSIDLMLGPFLFGSPLLPHVYIDAAGGDLDGNAFLAEDIDAADVSLTDLFRLGGTESIKSTDMNHEVTEGSILTVKLAAAPAKSGLYQGLALDGTDEPIAVITVRA